MTDWKAVAQTAAVYISIIVFSILFWAGIGYLAYENISLTNCLK